MDELREKSNLLAVSIVVTDREGRILLKKREKEPDTGSWELFAGYPYLDELPLEKATARILKEKAGISGKASLEYTGMYYDHPNRHPGKDCVPLIFRTLISEPVPESSSLRWFTAAELVDLPIALDNKTTLIDLGLVG